jgi:two-component system KDP operon response regulator KdpE
MANAGGLILLIEDDGPIRRFMRATLAQEGYRLEEAETGARGIELAAARPPDLVILDLGLPDVEGFDLLRNLRASLRVPIIVVSARGREQDKVRALDVGADDYLTKPFGVGELLARIRVAFRHAARRASPPSSDASFTVGELTIDHGARRVFVGQREAHLTPLEYRLLEVMARHAGKVLTHRFLLTEVWGADQTAEVQYLRVFMAGLRRKLEADPTQPRYLLTEQGVGYRLVDE